MVGITEYAVADIFDYIERVIRLLLYFFFLISRLLLIYACLTLGYHSPLEFLFITLLVSAIDKRIF